MLTLKKFRAAVKKAIKADYAPDATDAQIEAAIDEAADNIAMCDL